MVRIRLRAEIVECSKKGAALSVVTESLFVSDYMINLFDSTGTFIGKTKYRVIC